MKTLTLFFMGLFISFSAVCEEREGGGGRSVVCRDEHAVITSAELLDFYEGRNVFGYKIASSQRPIEDQYKKVLSQISHFSGGGFSFGSLELGEMIYQQLKVLPDDVKIPPINDSIEIVLPKNCQVEQLAHFISPRVILVDGEIWKKLDNSNRAGLIVHETIYFMERERGATDSRRSRRITAQSFDKGFEFITPEEGVPSDALVCMSIELDTSSKMVANSDYYFYMYRLDGHQWRMQFLNLDNKVVYEKKTFDVVIKHLWPLPRYQKESLPVSLPKIGHAQSRFEKEDLIIFDINQEFLGDRYKNSVTIQGNLGWLPELKYKKRKIHCSDW